jgi:hypothetical protein
MMLTIVCMNELRIQCAFQDDSVLAENVLENVLLARGTLRAIPAERVLKESDVDARRVS